MSASNIQTPVDDRTAKPQGKRPAWAEFALQEALRVPDEDLPADLAQRHDEYALDDRK